MRLLVTAACLLGFLGLASGAGAQAAPKKPTLVVLVTIDQFRADYLERFGPQMRGGIARLMKGGASFTNAHHDHAITETAPGHATLLAGRFPRSTGIMMNRIGVADSSAPLLEGAYGTGASPRRFLGTTLADWMRSADARSRALSVSMKDRAAILPIGRSRAEVYWYSPDGRFTTSKYYRDSMPGWVSAFNAKGMAFGYGGRKWTLLLPDSAYAERDSVPAESEGSEFTFPHSLPEDGSEAASLVRTTPFIDDLVVSFALDGVSALKLGAGPQTDLLAVSLSATDIIGHRFGPDSREIHDQVLRVDRAVGVLLDSLYTPARLHDGDRRVHAPITAWGPSPSSPRRTCSHGRCARRCTTGSARSARAWRRRGWTRSPSTWTMDLVFIDRDAFRKARVNADSVLDVLATALRAAPGVRRVDRFSALLADTLRDEVARRWSHQFPREAADRADRHAHASGAPAAATSPRTGRCTTTTRECR